MPSEPPRLIEYWKKAVQDLDLDVEAPFALSLESGARIHADLLLKHFGGDKGMLLFFNPPFLGNTPFATMTELSAAGYGVACSPGPFEDQGYERQAFIDLLMEWEWEGPQDQKPGWYVETEQVWAGKQARFQSQAQRLVGQRLAAVRYAQIENTAEEPYWQRDLCDCVDFGVELETDSGMVLGLTKDWGFDELLLTQGPIDESMTEARIWTVTGSSCWGPLIGDRITSVLIHWEAAEGAAYLQDMTVAFDPAGPGFLSPQILILAFASGKRVYLSNAIFNEVTELVYRSGDEIMIIFGEETAQQLWIPSTSRMRGSYRPVTDDNCDDSDTAGKP